MAKKKKLVGVQTEDGYVYGTPPKTSAKKYWKQNWWKYPVAALIIFITMMPLYVLIEMSFKEPTDLASRLTWPKKLYFGNYISVIRNSGIVNAYKNTVIIVISVILIEVFAGCLAAYALGRNRTKLNAFIRSMVLGVMMVPAVTILAGVYSILAKIGGINSYWALIFVTAAFGLPMSVYLYYNFIIAIPEALDDAARIDGANRFQCFLLIILPQLRPVTVTVIIMKGVNAWNDYLYPMYIMQTADKYTIVLVVKQFFSENNTNLQGAAACCLLGMFPIIVLYICLNKYFIKGSLDSAIK